MQLVGGFFPPFVQLSWVFSFLVLVVSKNLGGGEGRLSLVGFISTQTGSLIEILAAGRNGTDIH